MRLRSAIPEQSHGDGDHHGEQGWRVCFTPGRIPRTAGITGSLSIDGIARGDDSSSVEFTWNGAPIGVDRSGRETVAIPPLQQFTVTSAMAVQSTLLTKTHKYYYF